MIASERNLYILQRIIAKGAINIKDIARDLAISETTVRRDFEKLEKSGKLKRVQGGATLQEDSGDNAQLAMREKKLINLHEKQLAARCAAAVVKDGESVFLDCGTSIVPLGEMLLHRQITIVTTNTLLINLPKTPAASILLSGGQYHPHYNMIYGPIAREFLERFSFDHAFISCFGISLDQNKAFTLEVDSMQMKLTAMNNVRQKHLLLDNSKINRSGFYGFAELGHFDKIFCDSFPPEKTMPPNFCLAEESLPKQTASPSPALTAP